MSFKIFKEWLSRDLLELAGKQECTHLTERELELMQEAFEAGRAVQRKTLLIPVDICRMIREDGHTYNAVSKVGNWNQRGAKVQETVATSRKPYCRQCGLRIRPKQPVIRFYWQFSRHLNLGSYMFLHKNDCGQPLRENMRYDP
jgi:hypothetical protein